MALSRFFFAVGQIALQALVHIEQTASAVRKQRLAAEKAVAESQAQRHLPSQTGRAASCQTLKGFAVYKTGCICQGLDQGMEQIKLPSYGAFNLPLQDEADSPKMRLYWLGLS